MVVTLPVVVVDRTIRRLTAMNDRPNSPRSRIHMPLELVDIIIDYLYDDIESLSACSLVARDWRPSTRYHLFRDLRISGDNIFSGYDSFLHFLDKSPAICPFIRTLCLSGIGKPKIASGEQCLIGPYVLVTLLDRLTALHTLTLDQIVWGGVLRRSRKGFWPVKWPPTPRPFGTLRLHRVESHDFGSSQYTKSILQILQAFGAVQKLEVLSVEFDNMPSSDVARLHTPSALAVDHLVMHKVYTSQAFVSGLHNTATTGSLTSLDLQCNSTSDVQSFGTLIRAAGLQLKNLEVDLRRLTRQVATSSVANTMKSLNIASCTALYSLHLRICIHPEWAAPADLRSGWSYVASVLPYMPASTQSILITLTPPRESHEDASEVGLDHFFRHLATTSWELVGVALNKCKALKEVRFDMKANTTTKRQFKQVITKNLPVLDALKVLYFT